MKLNLKECLDLCRLSVPVIPRTIEDCLALWPGSRREGNQESGGLSVSSQ